MVDESMEKLSVDLAEQAGSRHYGKFPGNVTTVDDKTGYIKAHVPDIYGEADESPWALPAVPFAGKDHGFVALPEVGDGVWIEFIGGDISQPIWTGCWWGDGELPAPGAEKTRAWVTTAGHKLVLNDQGSKVQLLHAKGAELTLADSEITVKIGQSEATMTDSGEITLKVGATEISMTLSELNLKCGPATIKLSAAGVDINNGAIKVL
jgi:uncharacterized protein involved in type VI secretion and phage assembly